MQIVSYLYFNGNCEEALNFYEKALGGKTEGLFRFGGSPASGMAPAGWENKVMHARFLVGEAEIMVCDAPPNHYSQPQGFAVALQLTDPGEAERVFHALSQGGKVTMPIAETFWATRFGMLVDSFGIPWMINCSNAQQMVA
jgi:PhnB protein